jgi:hypothetical protein
VTEAMTEAMVEAMAEGAAVVVATFADSARYSP